MSEYRKRRSFARHLSDCVAPVAEPALLKHGKLQARILRDWPIIAGPKLAAITQPEKINFPKDKTMDGTLVLLAENAFALEVQHEEPRILEKLAVYFGFRAVTRVQLKQARLHIPPTQLEQAAERIPAQTLPMADALAALAQAIADDTPLSSRT